MRNNTILISCLLALLAACSTVPESHTDATVGRFQLHGEVVSDTASGLMWTRCMLGANWDGRTCTGKATAYGWPQAQAAATAANYAGYSDWRIPTLAELKTLVDSEREQGLVKVPQVNQTVFPAPHCKGAARAEGDHDGHSCWQWTSTPVDGYPQHAWLVYFGYAYNTGIYEADAFALRLVRSIR